MRPAPFSLASCSSTTVLSWKIDQQDIDKLEMAQGLLTSANAAAVQPYSCKQLPGRNLYEYSLGQPIADMPVSQQKAADQVENASKWLLCIPPCFGMCCVATHRFWLQAFRTLNKAAMSVLTILAKSPYLKLRADAFDGILDDAVQDPGKVSSSKLHAIRYQKCDR